MSRHKDSASLLEKAGKKYFRERSKTVRTGEVTDEIHILNEHEQAELKKIETGVVLRAAAAGALSAVLCGLAAWATSDWPAETWADRWKVWGIVYGTMTIAIVLEIAFLLWDSLRSVHALSVAAGLDLGSDGSEKEMVISSLVKAALEIPNPVEGNSLANPRRETRRWVILLVTLLYKAKVTLTNFVAKALVTGIGGRIATRAWLDFVAVPFTAGWDALIAFWVIREARIRAMGPSFVNDRLSRWFPDPSAQSAETRMLCIRAAASMVVKTRDLHPNLEYLLTALLNRLGNPEAEEPDDPGRFLHSFEEADAAAQALALNVLIAAAVIDGRCSRREWKLIEDAGNSLTSADWKKRTQVMMSAFIHGKSEVSVP